MSIDLLWSFMLAPLGVGGTARARKSVSADAGIRGIRVHRGAWERRPMSASEVLGSGFPIRRDVSKDRTAWVQPPGRECAGRSRHFRLHGPARAGCSRLAGVPSCCGLVADRSVWPRPAFLAYLI